MTNNKKIQNCKDEYEKKSQEYKIYENITKLLNNIDDILYLSLLSVSFEYYIWHTVYSFIVAVGFLMYKIHNAREAYKFEMNKIKNCMSNIEDNLISQNATDKKYR